MTKIQDAIQAIMSEALKGKQHKIDKNKNGKIDSHDFKLLRKEETVEIDDEQIDETVFVHAPFEYELKESYTFGEYLTAAKRLVGEEEAVEIANVAFSKQDTSIFIEEFTRSDIDDKINQHKKAGHVVSMPKYSTKSGKPYAEYVVTDKESGVRRKYIHHGTSRSVENMGAKKRDEE